MAQSMVTSGPAAREVHSSPPGGSQFFRQAPDMASATVWRATGYFLLAQQVSYMDRLQRRIFWKAWIKMHLADGTDPVLWLPALAATVRCESDPHVLMALAQVPLPNRLPPEAMPWWTTLLNAWKTRQQTGDTGSSAACRLALVSIDSHGRHQMADGNCRPPTQPCPWIMSEAYRIRDGQDAWERVEQLATLSAWCPGQVVAGEGHSDPMAANDWIDFWNEVRQKGEPAEKVIAAQALLNAVTSEKASPVPPNDLLKELAEGIVREGLKGKRLFLFRHLALERWLDAFPDAVGDIVRHWLAAIGDPDATVRGTAWGQLVDWDVTGMLHRCGVTLPSHISGAVKEEMDHDVLWELARWAPRSGSLPNRERLQELEGQWLSRVQNKSLWYVRTAAWQARLVLRRNCVSTEDETGFWKAYLTAVEHERNEHTLFGLALWLPPSHVPPEIHQDWQKKWAARLNDGFDCLRLPAEFALSWMEMETWWQKKTQPPVINGMSFQKVLTALESGQVPEWN